MRRTLMVLGLLLVLMGCIRPHYEQQFVDIPCSWRIDTNEADTICNIRWWEQFNDPVLNELIEMSLEYNQDIQVAINRVFEFYAQYKVVGSQEFPQLAGNATYNRIQTSKDIPGGLPLGVKRINNDFQLFLNLTWELDFWGRISGATEAAFADMLSTVEARRAVVLTVVSSVANAYIVLRQLDAQLAVSKKTLATRIESLKLAQSRFELGETSELEVKQAEAEAETAIISMLEFQRDIPQQENLLSILVGQNPHDIIRGIELNSFHYPVDIPAGLPSDLLIRRPDIVEAENLLIAANARVTEARALYFPQLELTGMYGGESDHLHNLLSSPAEMWQYGVGAVQDVFDAGRVYYDVKRSEAIRNEALFHYREVILTAFKEVNNALIACKMNKELVKEHKKQVAILTDVLFLSNLRYAEGEVDYLNVLDAERLLFTAELTLVQSEADNFNAVVALYSALGGGWVDDADAEAVSYVICD
jgi:multidrug efflux system outer membrane protein